MDTVIETHRLRTAIYKLLNSPALATRLDNITKHNVDVVRSKLKGTAHISTTARKILKR